MTKFANPECDVELLRATVVSIHALPVDARMHSTSQQQVRTVILTSPRAITSTVEISLCDENPSELERLVSKLEIYRG